ncbi:MAG: hypothetical protein J6X70_00875 [Muribaculaceae bacterium]|nr:hypothetical protein [Muribaculaceae bacterium]
MINFADISSWHFVTELDIIAVTTATAVDVSIIDASNNVLINGNYTPVGGAVHIYHLARLLMPLISGVTADFTITVGSTSKTVHVVQSSFEVSEGAATFLPSFFLSTVMSERDTSLERKELLTLLPIESTLPTVIAVCSYWDGEAIVTANKSVSGTVTAGTVCELDVSAAQFVDTTLGALVAYSITAGERTMRYRVTTLPTAERAMLLRNSFGAWEAIYFSGMTEDAPEYTRETAMVNGAMKLYNLEETAVFKSWTGPLRPSGVALARDLARSKDIYLLESGVATDAIVVTAVDVKHSTADNEIADFTFTWRRASLWSAKLKAVRLPRLFDETFDETYN